MTNAVPFNKYAQKWYKSEIVSSDIAEGTKRNYKIIINDHLIPYFQGKSMSDITDVDCKILMWKYRDSSWSQGNKVRMTLKRIFNCAISDNLVSQNPAEGITLPKIKSEEKYVRRMTDDEVELMYRTYEKTGYGLMFILMYETGLRPIEVMNQQWRNINLDEGVLRVSKPKNKARKGTEIVIGEYLLDELRNYKRYKRYVFNKVTTDKQHNEESMKFAWKKFHRLMDIENGARIRNGQVMQTTLSYDLTPILISRQCEIND